jgi:hypothetical protein
MHTSFSTLDGIVMVIIDLFRTTFVESLTSEICRKENASTEYSDTMLFLVSCRERGLLRFSGN